MKRNASDIGNADLNEYELREEYDLSKMSVVAKGRYAPNRRKQKNIAILSDDVAEAFPNDETVNNALRMVMRVAEERAKYKVVVNDQK